MSTAALKAQIADGTFVPSQQNARQFRDALGSFTTGVTVVTAQTPNGPIGMTANSFSSLSLDPPLVLWSPAKSSSRYLPFIEAKHFCINVLAAEQIDICKAFAKSGSAFNEVDWDMNSAGTPFILGSLCRFECELSAIHDGGDHSIIIGRVNRVEQREGNPLCFSQGSFGSFNTLS